MTKKIIGKLVLTTKEIKLLEATYKKYYNDLTKATSVFIDLYNKSPYAVKTVINKQATKKEALQSGILLECVICQTYANAYGLNNCVSLELDSLPKILLKYSDIISSYGARYAYFNSENSDLVLLQCGNPLVKDVCLIKDGKVNIYEIKDKDARLTDMDLLYDDAGKLVIADKNKNKYDYYDLTVDTINSTSEFSIYDYMGKNIPISSFITNDIKKLILNDYVKKNNVKSLWTIDNNDNLIELPNTDWYTALSFNGSEIRSTGKNAKAKTFAPKYFAKRLAENNVEVNANNICKIMKDNVCFKVGRGKHEITRACFGYSFFVKINKITDCGDYITFSINDIQHTEANISIHISLV